MPSIDFVNGSRETDGIFRVNFQVFEAANRIGFGGRWIECIDPSNSDGRFRGGENVWGSQLPIPALEQGYNRFVTFPRIFARRKSDWIFLGDPTFVPLIGRSDRRRSLLCVHDFRHLTAFSDRPSARWMYRYASDRLDRADRLVAHTEFLRDQLERMGLPRQKIYVVPPHAEVSRQVGEKHLPLTADRLETDQELTVLYVATDRPYKNLRFFLDLAKELESDSDPKFRFVLVSRVGPGLQAELDACERSNLTVVSWVPEVEEFYWSSDILAFPSLHEGFGLPLLEAMSHGLPVIANDIEPLREVVGAGGALVPVSDRTSWANRIRQWGRISAYRSAANAALDRAQMFSYDHFEAGVRGLFE